jgi:hypothetical protein
MVMGAACSGNPLFGDKSNKLWRSRYKTQYLGHIRFRTRNIIGCRYAKRPFIAKGAITFVTYF